MSRTTGEWLRRLWREPAAVTFVVLSIALTLAAAIAALSLNAPVMWRALPFDSAQRIVIIEPRWPAGVARQWLSSTEFTALSSTPNPLRAIGGYTTGDFIAPPEDGNPSQALLAVLVTPQFFDVLQLRPAAGRLPATDQYASGERAVLLSDDFWKRRYHAAPDIIGRTIRLSGPDYLKGSDGSYRVIGVLPRDTWLFYKRVDIVLPLRFDPRLASNPNMGLIEHVFARLADGTDIGTARGAMPAAVARIQEAGAPTPPTMLIVDGLQSAHFRQVRPQVVTILGIAATVVVLAALNLMIAAVAYAVSVRRELSIRLALGASAWRLFTAGLRQSAVTVAIAAVFGAALGALLTRSVGAYMPNGWRAIMPGEAGAVRIDAAVAIAASIILSAVALLAGAASQTVVNRLHPWPLLTSGAATPPSSHQLRSALVALEVALCACAIGVGGHLYLQLNALERVDLGVNPDRAFVVWLNLSPSSYPDRRARADYYDAALRRLDDVSGVESSGGVDLTFQFAWQTKQVRAEAQQNIVSVKALDRVATEGYLRAAGITLVDGRWFDERDRIGGLSTTVVSHTLARALWPHSSALGQVVRFDEDRGSRSEPLTVIGVVSDTRHAPYVEPDRTIYRSVRQFPPPWLYVVVRERPGAPHVAADVASAIAAIDRNQAIDGPWRVSDWIEHLTEGLRFVAFLTTILATIGAVLCAAGLYALTSCWVNESSRDLGVRRAVGASDRQIVAWFGRRCGVIVAAGLFSGVLVQGWVMHLLVAQIPGVRPPGWVEIFAGAAALFASALAGVAVPLLRALRTDAASLLQQS